MLRSKVQIAGDAKRLFLHLMEPTDVDAADAQLRDRLSGCIINNNIFGSFILAIAKIFCILLQSNWKS
jgi:hypothetical protein